MVHINPALPAVGDLNWGPPLNSAVGTVVAQVNSQDDVLASLPDTYATLADLAAAGGGGGGGGTTTVTGTLTATDLGNGITTVTTTGTGYILVDNGDGTSTLSGPTVSDNGNGTTSVVSGDATSGGGSGFTIPTTRSLSGTAYTLVLADGFNIVENTGTSTLTITIPTNATAAFAVNTDIEFLNYSSGSIILAPASGVVLRSPNGMRLIAQYASAAIRKRGTNEWVVAGYTSI
jgi:hypothetical protein